MLFRSVSSRISTSSIHSSRTTGIIRLTQDELRLGCKMGIDSWADTCCVGRHAHIEEFVEGKSVTANGFAKSANGFTLLIPSISTAIAIVGCMFTLSIVMKTIPVGITYASFAGLCFIATTIVGIYKFNQMPDLYTVIGLALIISGVLIVNLLGKTG